MISCVYVYMGVSICVSVMIRNLSYNNNKKSDIKCDCNGSYSFPYLQQTKVGRKNMCFTSNQDMHLHK